MLVAAVSVEFIIAVKSLSTETTLRVAFETTLVYCPRVVIAKFLVLLQILRREQLVLMRKDLFVASTQIAGLVSVMGLSREA